MSTDLLSFEHPSVLLFCFGSHVKAISMFADIFSIRQLIFSYSLMENVFSNKMLYICINKKRICITKFDLVSFQFRFSQQSVRELFKMDTGDRLDLLKVVNLIMSSKSKEERQQDILECLKSNPDIVMSLLKSPTAKKEEDTKDEQRSALNLCKARTGSADTASQPIMNGNNFASNILTQNITSYINLNNHSISEVIQRREDDPRVLTDKRKYHQSFEETSNAKANQYMDIGPIKKRKSKYYDIQGDFSHIEREPRTSKKERQTKRIQRCEIPQMNEPTVSQTEEDVILVRHLIDMLQYPTSRQRQECVLALLRSDSRLRKVFINEKNKIGKVCVPVFRRTVSCPETTDRSNQREQTYNVETVDEIINDSIGEGVESSSSEALADFLTSFIGQQSTAKCQNGAAVDEEQIDVESCVDDNHGATYTDTITNIGDALLAHSVEGIRYTNVQERASDGAGNYADQLEGSLDTTLMNRETPDNYFDDNLHQLSCDLNVYNYHNQITPSNYGIDSWLLVEMPWFRAIKCFHIIILYNNINVECLLFCIFYFNKTLSLNVKNILFQNFQFKFESTFYFKNTKNLLINLIHLNIESGIELS